LDDEEEEDDGATGAVVAKAGIIGLRADSFEVPVLDVEVVALVVREDNWGKPPLTIAWVTPM